MSVAVSDPAERREPPGSTMNAVPLQSGQSSSWRGWLRASLGNDLLLMAFLGTALLLRVLTDDLSSSESRHSGSLNLSGAIAAVFIVVAIVLLLRRRRGVLPAVLAALWLGVWTAIAVSTHGASTETLREGVREASVVALAVIVYNAYGAMTVPAVTRLVQLVGLAPALLALYQLPTHTGMLVSGHLRSNGTFAQPNSAVMFFGLAAIASLWRFIDCGRRRSDAFLVVLFAAAAISTFSVDGLITLLAMLMVFGALHSGSFRVKLVPYFVGGLVVLTFFATPLGTERIVKESSISLASAEHGQPNTDFAWRLHKWETLMPQWERSPLWGRGLGTTTTERGIVGNQFAGVPPLNEYVRYLVETGVVGLAILLGALAVLIRGLLRRRTLETSRVGVSNPATLAIVVVIGCLVNSLADNTFLNSPTAYAATLIVVTVLILPDPKRNLKGQCRGSTAP